MNSCFLNYSQSEKSFCLKVKDRIPEGEKLKIYQFYKAIYAVYTQRFSGIIWTPDKLLEWFKQDKQVYVVIKDEGYKKIKDNFEVPIYVLVRDRVRERDTLLLSNRPEDKG